MIDMQSRLYRVIANLIVLALSAAVAVATAVSLAATPPKDWEHRAT
jgi:hypothetical protein